MLLYKIRMQEVDYNKTGDYAYMINRVMDDYNNYFKASDYLKKRYDFCLQAIYSCLSKVNNDENRSNAYKELSAFLDNIKKINGINMKIINEENKLSVKERPKIKAKRRVFY